MANFPSLPRLRFGRRRLTPLAGTLAMLAVLAGCPHRFDSRADPIPSATDPVTEREYREARARYEAGDHADAAQRYATFVEQHPNDALVRSAKIGEARSLIELGQLDKATALLTPVARVDEAVDLRADPIVARARFLLGEALVRSGAYQKGRELLQRFRDLSVASDDEVELHALFAAAAIGLGEPSDALAELERFYAGARPAERAYIVSKAAEAVSKLQPDEVDKLWNGPREAMVTAFVGTRVAEAHRRAGDTGARVASMMRSPPRVASSGSRATTRPRPVSCGRPSVACCPCRES